MLSLRERNTTFRRMKGKILGFIETFIDEVRLSYGIFGVVTHGKSIIQIDYS